MIDQSDQSLVHVFLGPTTFSGIIELNHIKDKNHELQELFSIWLVYNPSDSRNSVSTWTKFKLYCDFYQEFLFQNLNPQLGAEKYSKYYLC